MTLKNAILLAAIVGAVAWYSKKHEARDAALPHAMQSDSLLVERPPGFQCSGKTRCSQMTSCEEATFYLENCPGTEIDGDGDGVPCEKQHCER